MRKILNIKEVPQKIESEKNLISEESKYFQLPENWKPVPETYTESPYEIISFREFTEEEKVSTAKIAKQSEDLEQMIRSFIIWGE